MSYNNDANEHTFSCGEHKQVVIRPPKRNRSNEPNADPTQNENVERWECLHCSLDVQAARGLGVLFSSRTCPPSSKKTKAQLRPTKNVDTAGSTSDGDTHPSQLPDGLEAFAKEIAEEHAVPGDRIADECDRLLEYEVPPEEVKASIRRAVEQGEFE